MARKHVARIVYKSGHEVFVRCEEFSVKRNGFNGALEVSWKNAKPEPLMIGVDDIESVWKIR